MQLLECTQEYEPKYDLCHPIQDGTLRAALLNTTTNNVDLTVMHIC